MDDVVDQSVLGNALQRISELERIGQHQLNTDPPRAEAANQTNATNAVEELYITSIPFVYKKSIE